MSDAHFPHRHAPILPPAVPRPAQVLELAAPLAFGQRGLVVAPPRCGATTVLRWLGAALLAAEPGLELHAVLVDRPVEDQLDWREELPQARVTGTSSDVAGPEEHVALTSVFHEAAAVAAAGGHVAVLVDSLGALARAFAATTDASDGRVLDGGIPQAALRELRGLFGLARCGGSDDPAAGSLTILATVLADTSQQLDEVVLHELVGTGNVEWRLEEDARRAGLFPPVDVVASGARRSELIIGEAEADRRALVRSEIDRHGIVAGLGLFTLRLDELDSFDAVLDEVAQAAG